LFISFLYFYALPSQKEGLFWYTGAIAYQVPNILCMIYIILVSLIIDSTERSIFSRTVFVSLAIILIIMIAGCNEISMAVLLLFNIILLINQFYCKLNKKSVMLLLTIVSLVVAVIVVLAPGNSVRESLFPDRYKIFTTIYMTVLGAAYYITQWLFMTILLTILSIPIIKQYLPLQNNFFKVSPWVSMISWIMILGIAFIVPAWATGQMPNPRAINVIFQLFILGWFYNLVILMNYHSQRGFVIAILHTHYIIVLILAIFVQTFNPGKILNNNIKYAYMDLLSGKAQSYSKQLFSYREEVRKSPYPIFLNLNVKETPYSFSEYVEDSSSVKNIFIYYHLKDKIVK
jgi:hypothetical protein